MFIKVLKRASLAAAAVLCVLGITACGGGKGEDEGKSGDDNISSDLESGVYSFDEKDMGGEKGSDTSNYYLKGNELYYMCYIYPEYPESYYEDLEKLEESMVEARDIDTDTEPSDGGSDNEQDDKKDGAGKSDEISDDISDDDLTGDIDDLFGNGDDADATEEPAATDKPDGSSDGSMTYEELEEKYKDYKTVIKMCKYNIETGEITDLMDFSDDENSNLRTYYIDDENRIIMLQEEFQNFEMSNEGSDDDSNSTKYKIVIKDSEGKDVSDTDITDKIKIVSNVPSGGLYLSECKFAPDGYLYVAYMQDDGDKTTITKIKSDGTPEGEVIIDQFVESMVIDNEGKLIISFYKEDKTVYAYADFDKGAPGEELTGLEDNSYARLLPGHGDISFFLKDSTALYRYDAKSKEKTMILNWLESGLVGDNVYELFPIGNGKMFCIYNDNEGKSKAGILQKSDSDSSDKKVLKITSLYTISDLQEAIIAFNKENKEYKIEYSSYENQEDPETAFANDIIAGNIPDIMDVSSIDVNNYINKGILEDITPYLEKDDTVNKDFFVDGVLDATAVDGKNYYLVKDFVLHALVGKGSDLKAYKDGWTVQEMIDYYNTKPEGTDLVQGTTKEGVFYEIVSSDIGSYIDWKTGEVKFNSDDFKSVLEFCNRFEKEADDDAYSEAYKRIKEGKLLLSSLYLGGLADIQLYTKLYDDDIAYVGYPSGDKNGIYMQANNTALAMTTVSENKDAVWEFMKYSMMQKDKYWGGIPAAKIYFDDMVRQKTTTEEYVDENGETVRPVDETYGFYDLEVKIKPSSEEEVQMLRDLIKKSKVVFYNYEILSKIEEEINKYFDGSKSLEDTVKIIQDKLSKYVNENK